MYSRRVQHGRGLGTFFKSIISKVMPFIGNIFRSPVTKQLLTTAKDTAIDAGIFCSKKIYFFGAFF